jgi:hypothetical protein
VNDNPADNLRRANQIKVPAVFAAAGVHPGPELFATVGSPVRLRIQAKRRSQPANKTQGARASQTGPGADPSTGGAGAPPSPRSGSDDPTTPVGPTGRPSMAPRDL